MKRTLISFLCILIIISATGQQNLTEDVTEAQSLVNISLDKVNKVFTPAPVIKNKLKSGSESSINVTYVNFPEDAKKAFDYAVSIWEKCISSQVQINIHANWEELASNELGYGKPSLFYRNFKGTPHENVFYPIALVEELAGKEYNSENEADITCSFNKLKPWYFGTDGNTPFTQYDFVTAVLHEIGHGLGISGFFTAENGVAQYTNSSNSPSVYDFFVFNTNQQRIADKTLFPIPSTALTQQLTSNSLIINFSAENNDISNASIYAPSIWESGVSIYHLKKNDFSSEASNELMNPYAYKGEAIHNPGINTLKVLSELGWKINSMASPEFTKSSIEDENLRSENLSVYPNPFKDNLVIDCKNIGNQLSVDIIISDLTGTTIYRETMYNVQYNQKFRIDLSAIKPGIYLASLTDNNLKTITKRIIKN